jgi:biofilm protein TabA
MRASAQTAERRIDALDNGEDYRMIADRMENLARYRGFGPNMDEAIRWLTETDLRGIPGGEHLIRGRDVRALVQEYETVPEAGRQYEAHRRFIDIQCIVIGAERMLVMPLEELRPAGEYDPDKDVVFFDPPAAHGDAAETGRAELTVLAGAFAVFFPQDAHMPVLQAGAPAAVKKVVVKVAV